MAKQLDKSDYMFLAHKMQEKIDNRQGDEKGAFLDFDYKGRAIWAEFDQNGEIDASVFVSTEDEAEEDAESSKELNDAIAFNCCWSEAQAEWDEDADNGYSSDAEFWGERVAL